MSTTEQHRRIRAALIDCGVDAADADSHAGQLAASASLRAEVGELFASKRNGTTRLTGDTDPATNQRPDDAAREWTRRLFGKTTTRSDEQ